MASIALHVVTPDGPVVQRDVGWVNVPGAAGRFALLPGHRPILAAVAPGVLEVDGAPAYVVDSGFFEGGPDHGRLLCARCVAVADLDASDVDARRSRLGDDAPASERAWWDACWQAVHR